MSWGFGLELNDEASWPFVTHKRRVIIGIHQWLFVHMRLLIELRLSLFRTFVALIVKEYRGSPSCPR